MIKKQVVKILGGVFNVLKASKRRKLVIFCLKSDVTTGDKVFAVNDDYSQRVSRRRII